MNPFKILVVDDVEINAEIIEQFLKTPEKKFECLLAYNGKSAFNLAVENIPDLIITDWEMPEMSGIELISLLKTNRNTYDIPVIICTGVMTTSDNLKIAMEVGAVDYIRKPIDRIELLARVNSMLKLALLYKKVKEQNIILEKQKDELKLQATEILEQKNIIENKNNNIISSIQYAYRIQKALLPGEDLINLMFNDNFVLYLPKDIVSGDFYWVKELGKHKIVAVADCTGHGVPGAFMSMLGISVLNEIISFRNAKYPNLILDELRNIIKNTLKQKGDNREQRDGMDIALCSIDKETNKLLFAGAINPIYIIRKNSKFIEIKPDRMPIGYYIKEQSFKMYEFQLLPNDILYLFTDGYPDQPGGCEGRKYLLKNFKILLHSTAEMPFQEQKNFLEQTFHQWRGKWQQVDDILVMGMKI